MTDEDIQREMDAGCTKCNLPWVWQFGVPHCPRCDATPEPAVPKYEERVLERPHNVFERQVGNSGLVRLGVANALVPLFEEYGREQVVRAVKELSEKWVV